MEFLGNKYFLKKGNLKMCFERKTAGLILSFVVLMFSSRITFAQQAQNLKAEIYPKLTDRRCQVMALDKCNCPDARELKAYIEALIETGAKKEDIFYRVAKKFTPAVILDKELKTEMEKRLEAEIGKDRPQISLENSSFDFGPVSRKQGSVKKNILISNKGNQDLIVKDIKVSCSCTTAALKVDKNISPYFGPAGAGPGWQMVIEPGKLAELEIIFDAANPAVKEGKVKRNISIVSNDPVFSIIEVKFEVQLSE